MTTEEMRLVELARAGDTRAFGHLIEKDWDRLVGLSRSIIGHLRCEDIVQEALLIAWQKLPQLEQPASFSSWLRKIVVRQCLRRSRRKIWQVPLAVLRDRPGLSRNPESELDVEYLLKSLAPRQRAVFYLTAIEGMTDSEIGELLDITAASVRSHRRRARQKLKKRLRSERNAEEVIGELG